MELVLGLLPASFLPRLLASSPTYVEGYSFHLLATPPSTAPGPLTFARASTSLLRLSSRLCLRSSISNSNSSPPLRLSASKAASSSGYYQATAFDQGRAPVAATFSLSSSSPLIATQLVPARFNLAFAPQPSMATLPPHNGHSLSALDLQFDRLSLGGQPQQQQQQLQQQNNMMHQLSHQILPVNKLDIPRRRGIVKFFSRSLLCATAIQLRTNSASCASCAFADSLKGFGFVVDNDPGALGGQEGEFSELSYTLQS